MAQGFTTLYKKLSAVLAEVGYIQKDKRNDFHKYNYASETAILERLHPLFVTHGLILNINCSDYGRQGDLTLIKLTIKIIDADSGQEDISTFYGEGQDKGDKGIYKAYTGAIKYFLMKTFMIPTGDDPEQEGAEEKQQVKQERKELKKEWIGSQKKIDEKAKDAEFFKPEPETQKDTLPFNPYKIAGDKAGQAASPKPNQEVDLPKYLDYMKRLGYSIKGIKDPAEALTIIEGGLKTKRRWIIWDKCKLLIEDNQLNDMVVADLMDVLKIETDEEGKPKGMGLLELHKVLEGMKNSRCKYANGKIVWEVPP